MDREPEKSSRPAEPGERAAGAEDPLADERKRKPDRQDPEREPHHELNNPVSDPDPTEWPDPYEKRRDPRGAEAEEPGPRPPSTSEPHPPATWERAKREGEGRG